MAGTPANSLNLDQTAGVVSWDGVATTSTSAITQHSVIVGGASQSLTSLGVGTTGQLLVGATTANPAFGSSAAADFTFTTATAGVDRALSITNTDNSAAASSAHLQISVGGTTSTGDPYVNFNIPGGNTYSIGPDNSDSGKFKITTGANPSAGTELLNMVPGSSFFSPGSVYNNGAVIGGFTQFQTVNTDATNANSSARVYIRTVTGGGDPYIAFDCGGAGTFELGSSRTTSALVITTGFDPTTPLINGTVLFSLTNAGASTFSVAGGFAVNSGGGAINIGTDAVAKTVTVGNTTGASATVINSGSGNIALNSGLTVNSSGINYNTVQPAFGVYLNTTTGGVTGDNTAYQVIFNAATFDQRSNYNTGTGVFTAPVTGRYIFTTSCELTALTSSHTAGTLAFIASVGTYYPIYNNTYASSVGGETQYAGSAVISMTVGDTCHVQVQVANGTKVVKVKQTNTFFSGFLAC